MQYMDSVEYIRKYCDNKQRIFNEKVDGFPCFFEQTAYHDVTSWYDAENDIMIESRYYIGD